jgi:hypothetical protein
MATVATIQMKTISPMAQDPRIADASTETLTHCTTWTILAPDN